MSSPAITTAGPATVEFPVFERFSLRFPIRAADMTIWPDKTQSPFEYALGHPLELNPFTWDYLAASCDGQRLQIEPHYDWSTWDTFWVDVQGVVVVHALRGRFRHTFGCQERLLRGICAVVEMLQGAVDDGQVAAALACIHARLRVTASQPGPLASSGPPLRGLERWFWQFKLCAWRDPPRARIGN